MNGGGPRSSHLGGVAACVRVICSLLLDRDPHQRARLGLFSLHPS